MFKEELLIKILNWQSESRKEEQQIIPNLIEYLSTAFHKNEIKVENDTHGNVFVTKGKADLYPCIVSHLDQVHKFAENKKIIKNGDYLLAFDGHKQVGTGGDDLVGVFMCLSFLKSVDNIKVAFFVAEEVGCVGSNACDLNFFSDCMFIGQADRRGNTDFIDYSNGVKLFDNEFADFVSPIIKKYNYSFTSGTSTDAGCLSKRNVGIACFNISSGYYLAHYSTEYVSITDVKRCYDIIAEIIKTADKQFNYTYAPEIRKTAVTEIDNELYKLLYSEFVKTDFYIKSNKMSYAYSKAIQFVTKLIEDAEAYIDTSYGAEVPLISDMLYEYLQEKELAQQEKEIKATPSNTSQLSMFDNCNHRNARYDLTMGQSYCMDCFSYIDEPVKDDEVLYRNSYSRGYNDYY